MFSFREHFVLSHSPEQLLSMNGRRIRAKPIAGTAAGSQTPGGADPLLRDPKLLAEHIMIVDLLRNDIGRVSRPGSVQVPRLMAIETYPHLRHLVSEVQGETSERFSRSDVIKSLFPGGSVTGAPRIRVRQHTSILEKRPRNYYCGSLGFVSDSGTVDLSLLIRSIEGERGGKVPKDGHLTYRAGAGIVADSQDEAEYGEILLKAQAIREILSS
jgi:anthranilate/para-aminobenzoate synthase component I